MTVPRACACLGSPSPGAAEDPPPTTVRQLGKSEQSRPSSGSTCCPVRGPWQASLIDPRPLVLLSPELARGTLWAQPWSGRSRPPLSVEAAGSGRRRPESTCRGGGVTHRQPIGPTALLPPLPTRFNGEEVCTCPQASVPEQFATVPWNSFNRDVLRALYGFAPISMHCNKSSAVRFQVRAWGAGEPQGAGHPPEATPSHLPTPARRQVPRYCPCAPQAPPRTPGGSDGLRPKELAKSAPSEQLEKPGGADGPRRTDGLQRGG